MRAGKSIAIIPVTVRGLKLALRLNERLKGSRVIRPGELKKSGLSKTVKAAYGDSGALVFIGAAGIAVRAVAPLLKGKHLDPAVIVMDEKGWFAISLLSGHLGGANRLAKEIAAFTGAAPVITTATDVMELPCVEDIAERFSFAIEDVKKIKTVNSAILDSGGEATRVLVVDGDAKRLAALKKAYKGSKVFGFKKSFPEKHGGFKAFIHVTSSASETPKRFVNKTMALRPREFVAGVGCKRGVSVKEIKAAVDTALKRAGVSILSVRSLATIDIKRDEKGLLSFAKKAGLPLEFFSPAELNRIKRLPSGASSVVKKNTGAGGVSEPAALLSSGAKRIWSKKIKTGKVTVALAKAPFTS